MSDTPIITQTKKQPYCKHCIHATSKGLKGFCKLYSVLQENAVVICDSRGTRMRKNR